MSLFDYVRLRGFLVDKLTVKLHIFRIAIERTAQTGKKNKIGLGFQIAVQNTKILGLIWNVR